VRLLAEHLGFVQCEWRPSANVSWSEIQQMQQVMPMPMACMLLGSALEQGWWLKTGRSSMQLHPNHRHASTYGLSPVQGGLQLQYTSKLGEFEDFVHRSKLPALALAPTAKMLSTGSSPAAGLQAANGQAHPQQLKLLVVEDLPHASGADSRSQLADALRTCRLCLAPPCTVEVGCPASVSDCWTGVVTPR
jgi:hypothetical protein